MKLYLKALCASVFALAVAFPASAQVRVGVHIGTPHHYQPQVVRVQPHYVPAPVYYVPQDSYRDSRWRERRAWRAHREAQWRRAEMHRREEWRREQWRREHWRDRGHGGYGRY